MNTKHRETIWRLLGGPGVAWLLLLFVAPVVLLLVASFHTTDIVGRPLWGAFTLESYAEIIQPMYLPVLARTFGYALATVGICIFFGFSTAYFISRYGGRFKVFLVVAVLLPWLVNYLVRIYAWLQVFSSDGLLVRTLQNIFPDTTITLLGTSFSVIVGLVYNYLPFMILPIFVALEALDERQVEACLDLFGTGRHVFWYAILPAALPGIIAGSTVVFLLSFGDFVTVKILGGPDQFMLGNLIEDQFSGIGAMPFGAALTACVLLLILVVLGLFSWTSTRAQQKMEG